jgi:hypothetical protein
MQARAPIDAGRPAATSEACRVAGGASAAGRRHARQPSPWRSRGRGRPRGIQAVEPLRNSRHGVPRPYGEPARQVRVQQGHLLSCRTPMRGALARLRSHCQRSRHRDGGSRLSCLLRNLGRLTRRHALPGPPDLPVPAMPGDCNHRGSQRRIRPPTRLAAPLAGPVLGSMSRHPCRRTQMNYNHVIRY